MKDAKIKSEIGKALRKFRVAAGLSQEVLADQAGIHRNYVGDVERGERNIAIVNLVRVAAAIGVPLSKIIQEMERSL